MIRTACAVLTLALFACPFPALAQDFEGRWEMTREGPRGPVTQILTLSLEEDGWVGTLSFMRREVSLEEVEVDGRTLFFSVEMAPPPRGGGDRDPIRQTFRGTLDGDVITGEMEGPRGARTLEFVRVPQGG